MPDFYPRGMSKLEWQVRYWGLAITCALVATMLIALVLMIVIVLLHALWAFLLTLASAHVLSCIGMLVLFVCMTIFFRFFYGFTIA